MPIQDPKSKIQNGIARIAAIFEQSRAAHRCAVMPFLTAGFPSMDATQRAIPALEQAGASIIELGIPFSDPIADGPVIAQSMHEALKTGVTPRKVFDLVRRLRSTTKLGLIAMVSDSIVTRIGPEPFVREAADAGFDGLIVPDIDLEAARPLAGLAKLHSLTFTLLVAPTTTPQRLEHITTLCTGFIYVLARVGITGESTQFDQTGLRERVRQIREVSALPIAVGFGISKAEHVKTLAQIADAAIVGSALVRRMGEAQDPVRAATEFVHDLV